MVVKFGHEPSPYLNIGYPQELLQHKYAVTRDEMLWREYDSRRKRGDPVEIRRAMGVLRLIRETPE